MSEIGDWYFGFDQQGCYTNKVVGTVYAIAHLRLLDTAVAETARQTHHLQLSKL